MKTIRVIIIFIVLAAIGFIGYKWITAPEVSHTKIEQGKISDITPMLKLCTVEIYDDVPIRGTIGSRHLFAKALLNGSISFDLNNIEYKENKDTILLTLPREIIEIHESTDKDSYRVIDTWNDHFFESSHFSTTEENSFKAKARENYKKSLYTRGLVTRARKEAVINLQSLMEAMTQKTVIITDPTPNGTYRP